MGADIYLEKIYQPNKAKFETKFEDAVKLRDESTNDADKEKLR